MATYSFQVQIPKNTDVAKLMDGGYQLGVKKSGAGSTVAAIPVQWLSVEILSPTITVSWDEEYFVYFTSQDLSSDGAQIKQSANTAAEVGRKYSYHGFFEDIGPASRTTGIEIENDLRSAPQDYYGIAQQVVKNGVSTQAPIIASNIVINKGTVGFTFAEEVTLYFTNVSTYTRSDGLIAKYVDESQKTTIRLKPGEASAVAFDVDSGRWTDVTPTSLALGVPRSIATARPAPTEINTLEELFAYEPALDINQPPPVVAVLTFFLGISATVVKTWLTEHFKQTKLDVTVKTVTPDGGTVKTVNITNNGNITREQITAAVEKLEGLSIPLQGGRYLAASGIYEYKTGDDKILKVEIKKVDATVAALRLILGQLAAAKKASSAPKAIGGTNGTYGGYINGGAASPIYNN